MLVKRAEMFPVECVARGYLAGSGWKEYQAAGTVCGIRASRRACWTDRGLPEPMFTPATKSQDGAHDENISFSQTEALVGEADAAELRRLDAGALPQSARSTPNARGLILADTKFEFGRTAEGIILADEVLTPDSSRFWEGTAWKPGGAQPSSTSSSFAIILNQSIGTSRRPRRVCRTKLWSGRRTSILKPSAA